MSNLVGNPEDWFSNEQMMVSNNTFGIPVERDRSVNLLFFLSMLHPYPSGLSLPRKSGSKVKVGNDPEKAQSEGDSHSKIRTKPSHTQKPYWLSGCHDILLLSASPINEANVPTLP